jgi:hypothetical protein
MSSSGEPCARLGKLIGGCKFEPRYDLGPVQIPNGFGLNYIGMALGERLEQHRKKTYVHDVCIRCGKAITVNRPAT